MDDLKILFRTVWVPFGVETHCVDCMFVAVRGRSESFILPKGELLNPIAGVHK